MSPFEATRLKLLYAIRHTFLIGFHGIDRKQWHPQIPHFFKQSVQCSLINHRASQKRIAIVFQRDDQALKPFCPLLIEMALDPDLIDHGLTWIRFLVVFFRHTFFPLVASHHNLFHFIDVELVYLYSRIIPRYLSRVSRYCYGDCD